jgi:hypothetical protein
MEMTYCKGASCPHWKPKSKHYLEVKCEYSGIKTGKDGHCKGPYEVKK